MVLVIGAGTSGLDLTHLISKSAKLVTLSHRRAAKPLTIFPDNVNLRPDVASLTAREAVFTDGSHQVTTQFYSALVTQALPSHYH